MKPIHKFNNGRGATLCHLCRTIITVGKPTNDLYCDRCLSERNHTESEFLRLKANLKKAEAVKANFTMQEYYEQMDKEVQFNRGNLNI
jgi:reverse gyrase